MKRDIETVSDIKQLVDTFYAKVRADNLLGPVFEGVIQDNWPAHLKKMYSFWETLLLDIYTYKGAPFSHHMRLAIDHRHFLSWMKLFTETVDELFIGKKAEEAKVRAQKIADLFESKMKHQNKLNLF